MTTTGALVPPSWPHGSPVTEEATVQHQSPQMPRAAGDWFELVHGLGVVDPKVVEPETCEGQEAPRLGEKGLGEPLLESLFWRAGAVGRRGENQC